jgi:hypothetical protein
MTRENDRVTDVCEHGTASHDGTESPAASAPEASRAWLLIEHPGPWPHEPTEAVLPGPLGDLVSSAAELGIRVQMIRRPGRRMGDARGVYAGWTAGAEPWLRRATRDVIGGLDLEKLAAGSAPGFGSAVREPVFLVCARRAIRGRCSRPRTWAATGSPPTW